MWYLGCGEEKTGCGEEKTGCLEERLYFGATVSTNFSVCVGAEMDISTQTNAKVMHR